MAVHNIGAAIACALDNVALRRNIAQAHVPAHRHTGQSQRKLSGQRRERSIRARAAGRGIRHDADLVATRGLRTRKIDHVTK